MSWEFVTAYCLLTSPTYVECSENLNPIVKVNATLISKKINIIDDRELWNDQLENLNCLYNNLKDAPDFSYTFCIPKYDFTENKTFLTTLNNYYQNQLHFTYSDVEYYEQQIKQVNTGLELLNVYSTAVQDIYNLSSRRLALKKIQQIIGTDNFYNRRFPHPLSFVLVNFTELK